MHVAIIGGAGTVGSTVAYALATGRVPMDVTIVDVDEEAAAGHAIDIRHATCHAGHALGRVAATDGDPPTVAHGPPAPATVADADCLVVTASAPRPADSARRGGRLTFLEHNRRIAREIGGWLRDVDPVPVICVTNPMDRITYALWEASGWPRERILGYSLSETARLVDWLSHRFAVPPSAISCPVLGEHGEHLVPVLSRLTVDDDPRRLSEAERDEALEYVRDVPYDVIDRRGAEESSRWVTARGVASVVEALAGDGPVGPVGLSVPLAGEYGFEGVCLSVPVVLDGDGWAHIETWDLSTWERERLEAAYRSVHTSLHGGG